MAKILQKYVKFSAKELEEYANTEGSCVRRVNTDMHLSMGPYGLASFKHALHELLIRTKVGIYDPKLNGIVLGIKNIKVLGQTAALRSDDPIMHLVINADFYVLRPETGAVLSGIVRHISKHQVSAIIYRVFNTTIRFTNKSQARVGITMEQMIKFRIKSFDISNVMPYIEGELLLDDEVVLQNKSIKFDTEEGEEDAAHNETNLPTDQDISATRLVIDSDLKTDLDALVDLIKKEPNPDESPSKKKRGTKRKAEKLNGSILNGVKQIKTEPI